MGGKAFRIMGFEAGMLLVDQAGWNRVFSCLRFPFSCPFLLCFLPSIVLCFHLLAELAHSPLFFVITLFNQHQYPKSPSVRYASMLLGRSPTNQQQQPKAGIWLPVLWWNSHIHKSLTSKLTPHPQPPPPSQPTPLTPRSSSWGMKKKKQREQVTLVTNGWEGGRWGFNFPMERTTS